MAKRDAIKYIEATSSEYANLTGIELNNDMAVCRSLAQAFMGYKK